MGAFLLSLILASNFLFELLLPFQEKNAFLYELLRKQFEKQLSYDNAKSREPSWLFLGDSQLMSGMDPQVLQRSTGKRIVFFTSTFGTTRRYPDSDKRTPFGRIEAGKNIPECELFQYCRCRYRSRAPFASAELRFFSLEYILEFSGKKFLFSECRRRFIFCSGQNISVNEIEFGNFLGNSHDS